MAARCLTSTATTMALPALAAHSEWQQRCRDESDRHGDGPLDRIPRAAGIARPGDERVDPVGDAGPVGDAADGAIPNCCATTYPRAPTCIPRDESSPAGNLDRPADIRPERLTEPRNEHKRHRYAFTPFGGARAQSASGWCLDQLEIKTILHRLLRRYRLELSRPDFTKAPLGLHSMPIPMDGCRSCCVPGRPSSAGFRQSTGAADESAMRSLLDLRWGVGSIRPRRVARMVSVAIVRRRCKPFSDSL